MILTYQKLKVDIGIVGQEEENPRDEEFVIPVVEVQSFSSLGGVVKIRKNLTRRLIEKESVCQTPQRLTRCF